jgi:tRNA(fMet)-specific endonuclease VapC
MGRIVYLLDTNILSEPAKKNPDSNVMQLFEEHDGQFATSAIVWHELNYGCAALPDSKRKSELQSYLSTLANNGLLILPYDHSAAEWFAQQRAVLKVCGKTAAYVDGEIAAVAVVNNLTLVSRNTDDFQFFEGLIIENWFEQS